MSRIGYSLLDTSLVPSGQRFPLFSAALGISHKIIRTPGDEREFDARLEVWMIGALVLSAGRQMATRISRDETQIRADGFDHFTLMMIREGSVHGIVNGPIAIGAEEIVLFDLSKPMDVTTSDNRNIGIRLPRQLLTDAGLPTPQLHGLVISGAPGRVLAGHCRTLLHHAPSLQASDAELVVRATVSLLATVADRNVGGRCGSRVQPNSGSAGLRERAASFIRDNLADQTLDPDAICRATNMTRSSLYRAFGRGGVASAIRVMRLEAIHDALRDPGEPRGIAELAFDYGFSDPAHFGRLFRRRYGYSPSSLRLHPNASLAPVYDAWLEALSRACCQPHT